MLCGSLLILVHGVIESCVCDRCYVICYGICYIL